MATLNGCTLRGQFEITLTKHSNEQENRENVTRLETCGLIQFGMLLINVVNIKLLIWETFQTILNDIFSLHLQSCSGIIWSEFEISSSTSGLLSTVFTGFIFFRENTSKSANNKSSINTQLGRYLFIIINKRTISSHRRISAGWFVG